MAVENLFNIDFDGTRLIIDQIPSAVIIQRDAALNIAAWLFSIADKTPGMRDSDKAFSYNINNEPNIPNIYSVVENGRNIRINSPPKAGLLTQQESFSLAIWLAFYCCDPIVSKRGYKDGEGLKERPELWIKIEDICSTTRVANLRYADPTN